MAIAFASGNNLSKTPLQDSCQSFTEHSCVLRALSVEYSRLIEQQVCGVLFKCAVVITQ
jgi:hypothetical protein